MARSARKKRKYSVALIGCGRVGSLLEEDPLRQKPCTHAGAFSACQKTEIVAGCDIDANRLQRFGKRWGGSRLYTDYKIMLAEVKPDIVCVAVWTLSHKEITVTAAESGVKAIFCEKPIALNSREGRTMLRACEQNGTKLLINHERRYEPRFKKARQMVRGGNIGPIKTIIGNALSQGGGKASVVRHGGGGYFHDGTHLIDLLLFFGGDVKWVSGFEDRPFGKNNIEETAGGIISFKNGAYAFVEGGGKREYFNFELDIQGTKGRIVIGNACNEYYTTEPSPRFSGFMELKKTPAPFDNPESPAHNLFVNAASDLVESIEKDKEPISSGRDGLMALKIIEATYKSARERGRRVAVRPVR